MNIIWVDRVGIAKNRIEVNKFKNKESEQECKWK